MRKIKKKKTTNFDINNYSAEDLREAEKFYHVVLITQQFANLLGYEIHKNEFNFKEIKRLVDKKEKIIFTYKQCAFFNDYKTSELIKSFFKSLSNYKYKDCYVEIYNNGVFDFQNDFFIKRCSRLYTQNFLRYVVMDPIEIKDFATMYVAIKQSIVQFKALYGDFFNDRYGKTFFTKFAKWCIEIEKDLCQVSIPIRLTNQRIANLKNGFREWKESRSECC